MTKTRIATRVGVVLLGWSAVVASGAERPEPPNAPPLQLQTPQVFGTTSTNYLTIGEWKFTPAYSAWTYGDTSGNQPMRYINVAGLTWLLSQPDLPSGAVLTYLEFDYCNTNGSNNITLGFYLADNHNNISNTITTMDGTPGSGCSTRSVDLSGYGLTIDNLGKRYPLYVFYNGNADATTTVAGAIIGYKLKVSPAPGASDFADVPTSDIGFQYIEALYASGITGGCGGGNFCPDNPVTRRQMAIFLAKALGLQWN